MLFDKDQDGVLSFPELATAMKALGQRPSGKFGDFIGEITGLLKMKEFF